MVDFTNCPVDVFGKYEGSDQKFGIIYNGIKYMLKLSDRISTENRNELNSSYSNSVYSEHVCCCILRALGYEVQETILGTISRNSDIGFIKDVPAVACRNFIPDGYELIEFKRMERTLLLDHKPPRTPKIEDIYKIFNSDNVYFNKVQGQLFLNNYWDLFVLDALLGNFDRHAENWAYLINKTTNEIIQAPIYDCGSCLYPQLTDENLEYVMHSKEETEKRLYSFPNACLTIGNRKVNYYDYMCSGENQDLSMAILRTVPRIDMNIIDNTIDNIDDITDVRKNFYKFIIKERYDKILKTSYDKVVNSNATVSLCKENICDSNDIINHQRHIHR